MTSNNIILTGDRPTGALHIGHYIGSLQSRLALQSNNKQFIMIADLQALTDNAQNPEKVQSNVIEVLLDYLAVGINPGQSTIFLQSMIPELSELTMYYLNLVSVARLMRNPTVKDEIKQKGFNNNVPVGFLAYPISQAADITAFKANIVPVGDDQLPVIEQTNEIVRKFNSVYGNVLVEARAMLTKTARLPGIDGKAKMSKSLGNAIFLLDSSDILRQKVMSMYTDPNHLKVSDPGKVGGNTVFAYLDAFDSNIDKVTELKQHYSAGGLGDVIVKKYLFEVLNTILEPIRKKREDLAKNKGDVLSLLKDGSIKARAVTAKTLFEVKQAMKIYQF
ncbi:MAG: tryptophan--tRNA ligase [Proteobacteria bacterium]|jgi:tryptophanyl-tRNA synthetase|nr:tryptophan--tRNA ligase [Pseudomonadota bacterium]